MWVRALADDVADAWREPVTYQYRVADWWGGVVCTVLASGLSYYCTSKYADFLQVAKMKQDRNDTGEPRVAVSYSVESGTPSQGSRASSAIRVVTIKTTSLLAFVVLLCVFLALDFVALALIPLSLIIPFTMLIFVWGSIYQYHRMERKTRFFHSNLFRRSVAIVVLVTIAAVFGPKSLYLIHVQKVVKWETKSVLYTSLFLFAAIVLHILRFSPKLTSRIFSWTSLKERDLNTIIRANLAGMLGGQALVLLKLVAEVIESALVEGSEFTFTNTAIVVVLSTALVCTALHIFSFHHMLAVLDEENVRLLVPVHRFALMLSASVGAAVYLEEWEFDYVGVLDVVMYSLSFLGLLLICVYLSVDALQLKSVNASRANTDSTHMQRRTSFSSTQSLPRRNSDDLEFYDVETGNAPHSSTNGEPQPTLGTSSLNNTPLTLRVPRFWDLGEGDTSGDSLENDDGFFMSSNRTLFHSPQKSAKSPGTSERRFSLLRRHAKAKKGSATSKSNAEQESNDMYEPQLEDAPLNLAYGPVRNTMMTKLGMPNPHTDGEEESRWTDPGDLPEQWKVRGSGYLQDRQKVYAGSTAMQVAGVQWSHAPSPVHCCSQEPEGFVKREHAGREDRPFMFVVNFMIPSLGNYVTYFVPRPASRSDTVFIDMLNNFVNAESDEYRNDRFKLIPGVKEGGMFVRHAVGSKPALLCKKLTTTYFSSWDRSNGTKIDVRNGGGAWFEVAIDVGSSKVARSIMGAVKGYASNLVLHMAYLLESKTNEELPERVLGGVDLYRPCMAPRAGVPLHLPLPEPIIGSEYFPESPPNQELAEELVASGAVYAFAETDSDTDGYDTEGSFRSVMDCGSDEEDVDNDEFQLAEDQHYMSTDHELDEVYPIPEGTMVMPKGVHNPYTPQEGKSFWVDAGLEAGGWKVRGPTYDADSVKVSCGHARMKIVAMDWKYSPSQPVAHVAAQPGDFIDKFHRGRKDRPFLLIVNFNVPPVGNFVTYLARNHDIPDTVFDEMLERFINAPNDEYRNARLKLIPGILEGSYFVRKAVGSKPALLCQKLTTSYFKHENCFEISIDVGSSMVGTRIFSAVKGFASNLVLHLGVVLESKTRHELPEQLLFGIDIHCPIMSPKQ